MDPNEMDSEAAEVAGGGSSPGGIRRAVSDTKSCGLRPISVRGAYGGRSCGKVTI